METSNLTKDEIEKLIKEKQHEISELNDKLSELDNDDYSFIIGRYYKLAATSIIRVDRIISVDDFEISIEGLEVTGDNRYNKDFKIDKFGYGDLSKHSINDNISEEEFKETANKWANEFLKYIK